MSLPDLEALTTEVAHTINQALTPVLERLAAAEARLQVLGDVRDRVVTIEAKSAIPPTPSPEPPRLDLTPVMERLATADTRLARLAGLESTVSELRDRLLTMEAKASAPQELHAPGPSFPDIDLQIRAAVAALQERIAVVEVRAQIPGPAGKDGMNGTDGAPGKDGEPGKDGLAGLSFEGVYQEGQSYEKGHLVTWGGSSWHCNGTTTTKPGEGSKDWTLMVKRGRDGRDLREPDVKPTPIVSVGRAQ